MSKVAHARGCLLGAAVGDIVGLPYENLKRDHVEKLIKGPVEPSLFLGYGMCSDDSEHILMTADALRISKKNEKPFVSFLSSYLKRWLAAMPPGTGLATARGIIKSYLGFPLKKCGVFSAGNGPAMRSSIIGVATRKNLRNLTTAVRESTFLTHSDPKAFSGALMVALAAKTSAENSISPIETHLSIIENDLAKCDVSEIEKKYSHEILSIVRNAHENHWSLKECADFIGCHKGITGYIMHTVPICLYAWLLYQGKFREGIEAIIKLGGDTDTTASIVGGLLGTLDGGISIPESWLNKTWDFGLFNKMKCAGSDLDEEVEEISDVPWLTFSRLPLQLIRNILMLMIVLIVWVLRTIKCVLPA